MPRKQSIKIPLLSTLSIIVLLHLYFSYLFNQPIPSFIVMSIGGVLLALLMTSVYYLIKAILNQLNL